MDGNLLPLAWNLDSSNIDIIELISVAKSAQKVNSLGLVMGLFESFKSY